MTDAEFVQAELWKVANAARREVAEEIATVAEEYADDLEPPTTCEWLELRDWFKGQLHEVAAKAREIGTKEAT